MSGGAHRRSSSFAAALLAVVALLPALHDAWSHRVQASSEAVAFQPADDLRGSDTGAEHCPICLARHQGQGLSAVAAAAPAAAPARSWVPHAAPVAALHAAVGTASPRAPPRV